MSTDTIIAELDTAITHLELSGCGVGAPTLKAWKQKLLACRTAEAWQELHSAEQIAEAFASGRRVEVYVPRNQAWHEADAENLDSTRRARLAEGYRYRAKAVPEGEAVRYMHSVAGTTITPKEYATLTKNQSDKYKASWQPLFAHPAPVASRVTRDPRNFRPVAWEHQCDEGLNVLSYIENDERIQNVKRVRPLLYSDTLEAALTTPERG